MLFKLTSNSSVLKLSLESAIHLDPESEYRLALAGFYSENNIQNLRRGEDVYLWDSNNAGTSDPKVYAKANRLESGYYTLADVETYFRDFLHDLKTRTDPELMRVNKTGPFVSVHSPVDFYLGPHVSELLGFEPPKGSALDRKSYYKADTVTRATNPPNIRPVEVIEIHCDIVEPTFSHHGEHLFKHRETPILYQFSPDVPHQYKISETPQQRHYVPIRKGETKLQHITVRITDHRGRLLENPNVHNIVYLDLQQNKTTVR